MPSYDAGGITASYAEAGAGAPIVLLHGSAGSDAHWRPLFERLGERFRLIAPNLHSYGETDPWPGARPLGLGDEAAIVHALIERLDAPVHLVGHSYGGAVAMRVALERPDTLNRLTLVEPAAFYLLHGTGPANQLKFREIAGVATDVCEAVITGDYHGGAARFVDYWNGTGAWAALKPKIQAAIAGQLVKIAAEFNAIMSEPATAEDYREIDVPTHILRGERSPGPVRRIAEILAGEIPSTVLATVAEAGHMLPLTHPDSVSAAVAGGTCSRTTIEQEAA